MKIEAIHIVLYCLILLSGCSQGRKQTLHDYHPGLPTDGNFLNNGLVDPYRNPHPHLNEVKKVYQPAGFAWNGKTKTLTMTNKNFFAPLENVLLKWTVLEDGRAVREGTIGRIRVAPQQKAGYLIDPGSYAEDREYILLVQLLTGKKAGLLEKGHELAFGEFALTGFTPESLLRQSGGLPSIHKSAGRYRMENDRFSLVIDKKTGEIKQWTIAGNLITNEPLRPDFWRPPTDNDLGNGMQDWARVWRDATYQARSSLVRDPRVTKEGIAYGVSYHLPGNIARVSVSYTVTVAGSLMVGYHFLPLKDSLPDIPRLGMYLILPGSFTVASWYGRGPHETYWDRKTSGKTAVYEGKIIDQFHRYSRPQETGNKTDVRWIQVSSDKIRLTVRPLDGQFLNCSTWPFRMSELDFVPGKEGEASASGLVPVTSRHGADIQTGDLVQWNIDHIQMGVGGDTSWGRRVHKEYTIPPKEYHYSFIIEVEEN